MSHAQFVKTEKPLLNLIPITVVFCISEVKVFPCFVLARKRTKRLNALHKPFL